MIRSRFRDKVVIVTGAASGIGRETALAFALEEAIVIVADVDEVGGRATVAVIEAGNGTARLAMVDVANAAAVERMIEDTVNAFGRLDVLHNNAYWAPLNRSVTETSDEEWGRTLAVTLTSVFLGCKFAIPHMIAGGGGSIVNTASTAALVASPRFAAYMAAKGGVVALTRSVAFDYGAKGIRCNAVCPGLIRTAATEPVFRDEDRLAWLTSKIVVGRAGQPSDIASAVLYLASEDAGFITGQALVVDGGRLIG